MFANVVTKVFEQIIPARVSIVEMLGCASRAQLRMDDVSFGVVRESFGRRIQALDDTYLEDIKEFHDYFPVPT